MKKNWFSSDFHVGHDNILNLCNRLFSNTFEHDETIAYNHNSVVADDDIVWNLGDVGFRCSPQYVSNFLKRLKGIHNIILGNHEKPLRQAIQMGLLDDMFDSGKLNIIGGKESVYDRSISISKLIEIEGQKIFISHYGLRTWPSAFRGTWMLYGHSHNNLPQLYKSFDVGIDTETETHKRFYPWSFEEIKNRMSIITEEFSENISNEK